METTDNTVAVSASKAAAIWWATTLGAPSFRFGVDSDAALQISLQQTVLSLTTNTEEAIEPIVELIREVVEHAFATNRINRWEPLILKTDYHPEEVLANIAVRAGTTITWPFKTTMRIYPDHIEVRAGYDADVQTIWQQS